MCTALRFPQRDCYLGRTLDLEYRYDEAVVITPRGYRFEHKKGTDFNTELAIAGIATVKDGYPLYYDAVNEAGLFMAGLNFTGNAKFSKVEDSRTPLAQYELIPFVLGHARTLRAAADILKNVRLVDTPYDESTPVSELHYFLGDSSKSLAAEPCEEGFAIYEDPFDVLTNNPPFPYHKDNIQNYLNLTAKEAENRFSSNIPLRATSRGIGAFGLPGDLSSPSRFIRAAFAVANAEQKKTESEEVGQVFHVLDTVSQTEGLVKLGSGLERTQYTVCANLRTGTYYYKTYSNSRISAVTMTEAAKSCDSLSEYPLRFCEDIYYVN